MYPYVETAVARKAMDGYPDGSFKPSHSPSRADAARALVLAAGWKLEASPSSPFLDVTGRHRLYPYIATAYAHGAVAPDNEGYFHPESPASRGFVSIMVFQMMQGMVEDIPLAPDDDPTPEGQ
jgi:N-acetylmuramoyl-L-alanine amidase